MSQPFDIQAMIQQAIAGGNDSIAADLDPVTLLKKKRFGPDLRLLPDTIPGTPAAPQTAGTDPLESQIMALLNHRQGLMDRLGPLPVPAMPRSSNERDVNSRSFLSGLVGGFNSGLKNRNEAPNSALTRLLQLQEQKRFHDMQGANMAADNTRADAQMQALNAYREWQQTHGDAQEKRLNDALGALIASRSVDDQRLAAALAEQMRHNRATEGVAAGNLAERKKENAAGGGKSGASPYTSNKAYFDSIADTMVENATTKIANKKLREKTIAKIRSWQAQQTRDLALTETERRGGAGVEGAAPPIQGKTEEEILKDLQ